MFDGTEDITPGGTKKTAKLQIDKPGSADSGRRLVEYFVVISSVEWHDKDKEKDKGNGEMEWRTEPLLLHDDSADAGSTDGMSSSSLGGTTEELSGFHFRPAVTARYPLYDHHDNPLHENVTFFCHPSGGIQLRTQEEMPKVRSFTQLTVRQLIRGNFVSLTLVIFYRMLTIATALDRGSSPVRHTSRHITLLRPEAPASKSTEPV